MAKARIRGGEYTIDRVFGQDFLFRIPLYQRPYAWQQEQAEELLDDLLGFVGDDPKATEEANPYFLGSIVVIKDEDKPEAEVVDGQQRLTTLTILISALRSHLTGELADAVTPYLYEKGNPIKRTEDRYRLTLRSRDAEFFRDYVQRPGQIESLRKVNPPDLTDSQRNIRNNAILYLDRLKAMPEERRWRLLQFVVNQCLLVVVSTPDFESAYRIFTVLNDRGLDLSQSDILKSEIIGSVPSANQQSYGKKWEDAEELLGREAFADLFSHTRSIYRKAKPKGTVLSEFREYVLKANPDPRKLIDQVLIPFADAFADIRTMGYESTSDAEAINTLFGWLNRIDNIDWMPPAILFLSRHRHDPAAARRFFADLERLAAVQMILRTGINDRISRYGDITTAIEMGHDLYAPKSPLQLEHTEKMEAWIALFGDIYLMVPRLRTYILLRLDSALSSGGATYDHGTVTVEHVLPQNPEKGSQWETWWPDPAKRLECVHKLGNMALLTRRKNSSASNYEFDKKKAAYFVKGGVSPFVLTTDVVKETEWTPPVFNRRQAFLAKKLIDTWRLDLPGETISKTLDKAGGSSVATVPPSTVG